MKTVEEIRRTRLLALIAQHAKISLLLDRLGFAKTDNSKLSRIANANLRHDRGGQPYVMGSAMARRIEDKLGLEVGWMDNMPSQPAAPGDENDPIVRAVALIQAMEPEARFQAVRLLDALAKPARPNGTTGN
jgi:hypothetical protein